MRSPRLTPAVIFVTGLLAGASCTRVPGDVIKPDDMAELMADIHTGEAVTESNYQSFGTDSARQALKQAILKKHDITQEQLDSSLMWYGRHLKVYQDVYEETEKILQERLDNSTAVMAAQAAMSLSGDSVDIWSQGRRMAFGPTSATNIVTFSVKPDNNTKKGDSYTWRGKFFNLTTPARMGVVATYDDGTTETFLSQQQAEGWSSLTFVTDSTLSLKSLRGYMVVTPENNRGPVYVDSIQLVRNRLNPDRYMQRYRQRAYLP